MTGKSDVFTSIIGKRRKPGSDVTDAIACAKGRKDNAISWTTKSRWIKAGLITKDGDRLILTKDGAEYAKGN